MTKLLIDECLSSELALMARERGHHEASHVVWIGKSGWKDWQLKQILLAEDWVLVTRNSGSSPKSVIIFRVGAAISRSSDRSPR